MLRLAHKEYDVAPVFEVLTLKKSEILMNIWLFGKHKQGPDSGTEARAEARAVHQVGIMNASTTIENFIASKRSTVFSLLGGGTYPSPSPALRCYLLFRTNAVDSLRDSTAKNIQMQKGAVFLDEEMSVTHRLRELGSRWTYDTPYGSVISPHG
jgi:hypothetical protein